MSILSSEACLESLNADKAKVQIQNTLISVFIGWETISYTYRDYKKTTPIEHFHLQTHGKKTEFQKKKI